MGRSETSIRRRHPPKIMALSDRSLSNIPKRKSAIHETKNVRSQESSATSSTGKATLTSDTGSDIATEY